MLPPGIKGLRVLRRFTIRRGCITGVFFLGNFVQSLTCPKLTMKTLENSEISLTLAIKTPERLYFIPPGKVWNHMFSDISGSIRWVRSGVFIINFDPILHFCRCFYHWTWTGKFLLGVQALINQLLSNVHWRTSVVQYLFVNVLPC